MAKTLINDDELENVVGGAALELSKDRQFLTIDMTKNKETSLEDLIDGSKMFLNLMGAMDACEAIKNTINANSNIVKCVVDTSSFTPKYYDINGNEVKIN